MSDPEPSLFGGGDAGLGGDPASAAASGLSGAAGPAGRSVPHDAPLAVRMRPQSLSEVLGQQHLLEAGAPLRRLVEGAGASSVILYGPPGTGKTTIASLISAATGRRFASLSALSAGVKEVRAIIEDARRRAVHGTQTVLFIDEVHRFSKTQQDALLSAVENRIVLLVAATTENPSFSIVSPLLSRSLVLQLRPLADDDVARLLRRAAGDERGLAGGVAIADDALDHLVALSAGDARRALTTLEAAADVAASRADGDGDVGGDDPDDGGDDDADGGGRAARASRPVMIDLATVESAVDRAAVRYDRDGDQHYDVVSAFIKSIRGSDVDAAVHYLARMITAGEDPRFIARRLMIHASEDIGLADPTALQAAVSAAQVVQMVGLPEARLALAQATIHLASAPKSGAVNFAISAAMSDIAAGKAGTVPPHLRDGHYAGAQGLGNAVGYRYPHDAESGVLRQQYPPDTLVGVDYYAPTAHGAERERAERLPKLRRIVRGR